MTGTADRNLPDPEPKIPTPASNTEEHVQISPEGLVDRNQVDADSRVAIRLDIIGNLLGTVSPTRLSTFPSKLGSRHTGWAAPSARAVQG
jgi:hypothetical protein